MGAWNLPNAGEEEVFTGLCPIAYTNLDLTTSTGLNPTGLTGAKLALLRITPAAGNQVYSFRTDGDGDNFHNGGAGGRGVSSANVSGVAGQEALVVVASSDGGGGSVAGNVEWMGTAAVNVQIRIVAWADVQFSAAFMHAGAVPVAFANLNPAVAATNAIVFSKANCTANPEAYAQRPDNDGLDYFATLNNGASSHSRLAIVGETDGMLQETDAGGLLEHRSATGALAADVDRIIYEIDLWSHVGEEAFPSGYPPLAWTEIDMSAILGPCTTGVLLRVHREPIAGAGVTVTVAFRPAGSTADFRGQAGLSGGCQWCQVDADQTATIFVECIGGKVEWIASSAAREFDVTILGVFNDPPVVTGTAPAPGAVGVLPTASIEWNAIDENGVDPTTLNMTLTPPVGAPFAAITAGIWEPRWGHLIAPNAGNGYDITADEHENLYPPGLWQVDVDATDILGKIGTDTWTFTVTSLAFISGAQRTLNSVEIEFDRDPKHLDPVDPHDGTNLSIYTITGPVAPFPVRLLQAVTHEETNKLILWFDGELVPGEVYQIDIAPGLESTDGVALFPGVSFSFTAFGADWVPVPPRLESIGRWDIHNPQVGSDSHGGGLGVMRVDDQGDIDVETHREYLRKRILRRVTTSPGGFAHLTDYGLAIDSKTLLRPSQLRALQRDAETQVLREPDVVAVRAVVSQPLPGIVRLTLRVRDTLGEMSVSATLGGE